ncbi:hypothetical protein [Haloarcula onubensis]|uniref:Ig-like domain-containing protein n=1 Tax=Haloarcula onubensis TaxID=2950539 RepID=A0ABU2FUE0_9EURY|nr:hypothetical protein [Halomicroarcula sp. S3CR25-11]MDS0283882.1 hypothetical protein [Halomicroarcula sp. S3CR25-11]
MIETDTIPVSVPLKPGISSSITVPQGEAIMYWCALEPSIPGTDDNANARTTIRNRLAEFCTATLYVDDEPVGVLDEFIGQHGLAYWTLTDPLPVGPHEITFTIADNGGSLSKDDLPPVCRRTDGAEISWQDREVIGQIDLIVTEADAAACEITSDPLWEKKDVYIPIEYVTRNEQ